MSVATIRTDQDRINFEPFGGDRDVDIQCRTVRFVVTRKPHPCSVAFLLDKPHDIEPGTRVIRESAKVDGEFGTCHYCVPCLDTCMDKMEFGWED